MSEPLKPLYELVTLLESLAEDTTASDGYRMGCSNAKQWLEAQLRAWDELLQSQHSRADWVIVAEQMLGVPLKSEQKAKNA